MASSQFLVIYLLLNILETCYCMPKFYLYDFQLGTDRLQPIGPAGEVAIPLWKFGKPIKVIIHGWNPLLKLDGFGVLKFQMMHIVAREFRRYNPDYNIVLVDWTFWATTLFPKYYFAAADTRIAGIAIAKFLKVLKDAGIIFQWNKLHILGHSLGGQVAGVIGHEIQKLTNGKKVGRITGLDPAGPGFSKLGGGWPADTSKILDFSDAEFVDIIHTSEGGGQLTDIALNMALGSALQSGHADFYPNGGKKQSPQCNALTERTAACSHTSSVLFYALSLREPQNLVGCPCNNYKDFLKGLCHCKWPQGTGQPLGEKLSTSARGKYYLQIKTKLSPAYFD